MTKHLSEKTSDHLKRAADLERELLHLIHDVNGNIEGFEARMWLNSAMRELYADIMRNEDVRSLYMTASEATALAEKRGRHDV